MKFFVSDEHPKGAIRIWEKFVITGRSGDGDKYLTRRILIDTPWFGIFLHEIHRPDAEPILHDHPWPFAAFVLRGGYDEHYKDMNYDDHVVPVRHVRFFNLKLLKDAHFISALDRYPTWTLVFVGPTKRVWGYWEQLSPTQRIAVSAGGRTLMPGTWYRTEWMHHSNHGSYRSPEEQARIFEMAYEDPQAWIDATGAWHTLRNRSEYEGNWTPQERSRHDGLGYAHDPFANDGE